MQRMSTVSQTSIRVRGKLIPGAEDRQGKIPGFSQEAISKSRILCIGAGGLISYVAPTLVRKGVGALTILDDDTVDASNLNRQRFYEADIGKNKAIVLALNLQRECIFSTEIKGLPLRLEEATELKIDLNCDVAICGVDNNPARVAAVKFFRSSGIPVIFMAVSRDGDHGYIFVQGRQGSCLACLFPDIINDDRYPCPGTPAIADILQAVGALSVYAVDTLVMSRARAWNYRRISLSDGSLDGFGLVPVRESCTLCHRNVDERTSH